MRLFEGLFATTWDVTIDDGGVRAIARGAAHGEYIPFTDITDARVEFGLFRVAMLRLVTTRETMSLPLSHDEALFVQAALLPHIGVKATAPAIATMLARNGRTLDAWLTDVSHGVVADGYRAAAMDSAALAAVLDDPSVAAEVRAAAVHALLHDGREDDLVTVVHVFVRHALPPIVVVAAALAPGGAVLVPEWMWNAALEFLPIEEAAQARALAERVVHKDEGHVYELLRSVTADEVAKANARRAAEPRHVASKRKYHASALGGGGYAASQGVTRFR